jgi:hypothetical protein
MDSKLSPSDPNTCKQPEMRFARILRRIRRPTSSRSQPYSSTSTGEYSIILPKEPFVWGVSHIIPHDVPVNIQRPPYARLNSAVNVSDSFNRDPYTDDGRICFGSSEEGSLRKAGSLAKDVLAFAGTLVKVRSMLHQQLFAAVGT